MEELIIRRIVDSIEVKKKVLENRTIIDSVAILADEIVKTISNGNKLVICGNGGSASDSLHFAAEIVGRFQKNRDAWPAIVLNADVSTMTAIANDYGYDDVFSRQAQALVNKDDIFLGISTSGNSENVLRAIKVAKNRGAITAALLGKDGGRIKDEADNPIVIPCDVTARVQECHILLIHIICELVEGKLA